MKDYAETFLRDEIKVLYKTSLGIKIFQSCLELANQKHKHSTKKLFYKWHHNVFPKAPLCNLAEEALRLEVES